VLLDACTFDITSYIAPRFPNLLVEIPINDIKSRNMVRQHGSLEKDAETNQAAWEAAKGAAWGGTKVSRTFI
jgi:hypothetical protein